MFLSRGCCFIGAKKQIMKWMSRHIVRKKTYLMEHNRPNKHLLLFLAMRSKHVRRFLVATSEFDWGAKSTIDGRHARPCSRPRGNPCGCLTPCPPFCTVHVGNPNKPTGTEIDERGQNASHFCLIVPKEGWNAMVHIQSSKIKFWFRWSKQKSIIGKKIWKAMYWIKQNEIYMWIKNPE